MKCELPAMNGRITLAQGGGGPAMRALIEDVLARGFAESAGSGVGLAAMDDGAALPFGDQWLVVTTDSHVIQPLFFAGGDIGRLAVAGTVNDLAMMGATEVLALTCAIVLEEGFPSADLRRIHESMSACCREAGAAVVTGDTKVMGRGEVDRLILNTTGIGVTRRVVRDNGLRTGDRILVSGRVGDHGLAVLAGRHELGLEGELRSDVAPLNGMIRAVLDAAGDGVVAMKDPTRGGLAGVLHEMARKSGVGILLDERSVPVGDEARAAAELLGIDPLQVANEGKAVLGVRPGAAEQVLAALRAHPLGREAAIVGTAVDERVGAVVVDTGFGRRLLNESDGEPLPRIC